MWGSRARASESISIFYSFFFASDFNAARTFDAYQFVCVCLLQRARWRANWAWTESGEEDTRHFVQPVSRSTTSNGRKRNLKTTNWREWKKKWEAQRIHSVTKSTHNHERVIAFVKSSEIKTKREKEREREWEKMKYNGEENIRNKAATTTSTHAISLMRRSVYNILAPSIHSLVGGIWFFSSHMVAVAVHIQSYIDVHSDWYDMDW